MAVSNTRRRKKISHLQKTQTTKGPNHMDKVGALATTPTRDDFWTKEVRDRVKSILSVLKCILFILLACHVSQK